MNDQYEMAQLLKRIDESEKKQVFYARLQCIFSLIAAVCCIVLLFMGIKFLPQIQTLSERANVVLSNLEGVTQELSQLDLSGLEDVVNELSEVDLTSMVDHIDELITASHEGVTSTMDKLGEINFEALNQTIEDLSTVVEKLAKITRFFG
jgi:hypothetical protein